MWSWLIVASGQSFLMSFTGHRSERGESTILMDARSDDWRIVSSRRGPTFFLVKMYANHLFDGAKRFRNEILEEDNPTRAQNFARGMKQTKIWAIAFGLIFSTARLTLDDKSNQSDCRSLSSITLFGSEEFSLRRIRSTLKSSFNCSVSPTFFIGVQRLP